MAASTATKNVSARGKFLLNKMNATANDQQLGTMLFAMDKSLKVARCVHDISGSVHSGAVGSVNLDIVIPNNSLVLGVYLYRTTQYASAGTNGTLALTLNSAGDVLAAVDADTIAAKAWGTCTLLTASTAIVTTAARTLVATVAVEALTAGKYDIIVMYLDLNVNE